MSDLDAEMKDKGCGRKGRLGEQIKLRDGFTGGTEGEIVTVLKGSGHGCE